MQDSRCAKKSHMRGQDAGAEGRDDAPALQIPLQMIAFFLGEAPSFSGRCLVSGHNLSPCLSVRIELWISGGTFKASTRGISRSSTSDIGATPILSMPERG